MMSARMPWASSALITPICANPRAAPPPSARGVWGGAAAGAAGGAPGSASASGVAAGGAAAHPASAKASKAARNERIGINGYARVSSFRQARRASVAGRRFWPHRETRVGAGIGRLVPDAREDAVSLRGVPVGHANDSCYYPYKPMNLQDRSPLSEASMIDRAPLPRLVLLAAALLALPPAPRA